MTMSPRERNAVIIGLGAVSLFLALQYLAFPLLDNHNATRNQLEIKASLLQQYEARLHMRPQLEGELEGRQAKLEIAERRLIAGATPALGAARVQLILDDLSSQKKGIEIKSTRVLDAQEDGLYTQIAVRIALTGQTKILTDFLYDIEHQQVRLSVSELTVRIPNPKKSRDLRADVVIEALMKQIHEKEREPVQQPTTPPRSATT